MSRPESCHEPAGESPVRVSAGAPGSRPQPEGESPQATAGRQEPHRREQERGPQHQVNPAVSSDLQWESRAEHVAAKATSAARVTGFPSAAGLPGIWGAARAHGSVRNRRDPSAPPPSGQGRAYKPMAKARGAQRESEGVVVPVTGAQQNAPRGKGPCFGRACGRGKREGMAGSARPNHPDGLSSIDKVRGLHRKLWTAAKRYSERRFHTLSDSLHRSDVLWKEWQQREPMVVQAVSGRPSLSRVQENCTHGLKGGAWRRAGV